MLAASSVGVGVGGEEGADDGLCIITFVLDVGVYKGFISPTYTIHPHAHIYIRSCAQTHRIVPQPHQDVRPSLPLDRWRQGC